jgi:hypothetical protein
MGRSTVLQLIQRAKNMNEYNNSGVASDVVWLDHFNSALIEMADDLNLEETIEIPYIPTQTSYDLPDGYYSLVLLNNKQTNQRLTQKRYFDQLYPPGYWVTDKGYKYVIDITFPQATTFVLYYERYPDVLEYSLISTQKPDVPTIGETALCYKAISHALKKQQSIRTIPTV